MAKVGRPSKYNPAFCERVIELGKEGMGKCEMAAKLGVHYQTFEDWQSVHPEFSISVKEALRYSQAWWEEQGRKATFGGTPGFNATSFIFNMKNRFKDDWRDKVENEITGPDSGPVQIGFKIIDEKKG